MSTYFDNKDIETKTSSIHAMETLQKQMKGEAEHAGITSDEAIMDLVKQIRNEDNDETDYDSESILKAVKGMTGEAVKNGNSNMTLDEINAEISKFRQEQK